MGILQLCLLGAIVAAANADVREAFNTTPPPASASFSCVGRRMGFYADVESNCRAYHMCDDHGNHFTHHCPEDTAFRQDAMICDHAYLVDCQASVKSAPTGPRFGQDANHDAPPSSFVEPHGEGSNARGFARSFRINPDAKAPSDSKHPTFVLNSSVFLTNRDASASNVFTSTARPQESQTPRPKVTSTYYKGTTTTTAPVAAQEKRHFHSTASIPALSEELLPPLEISKVPEAARSSGEEEYSFLVPPPTRSDNVYYQRQSAKTSQSDNHLQRSSAAPSKASASHLQKSSQEPLKSAPRSEPVTFSPRQENRQQGRELNPFVAKPVNFLEPPLEKPGFSPSARSNFNFRGDDYPYVETLRSIQNNNPSTTSSFGRATTSAPVVSRSTEASIFPVPKKQLVPGGDGETDPYYPKVPTTTEAFYTPRQQTDRLRKPFFTTRRPPTSNAKFEIPAVLPDLNSLEDLLDRRKFFFIPQIKSN